MSAIIYSTTEDPVAKFGYLNGKLSVVLNIPDGSNEGDCGEPDDDDFDGESITFDGKLKALRWLDAARESVLALRETPTPVAQ